MDKIFAFYNPNIDGYLGNQRLHFFHLMLCSLKEVASEKTKTTTIINKKCDTSFSDPPAPSDLAHLIAP